MARAADPARAPAMQAYMKSAMPYYGLRLPDVRAITRDAFAEVDLSCEDAKAIVMALWRGARRREERYAAVHLLTWSRFERCLSPADMPMLEELVVTGAWWDHVDELAMVIGELLRRYPRRMRPLMRAWSTDADMWKRRVSIICQLRFKADTDLDLLYSNIGANAGDSEFFIRKAIGWALRQYAWTDPDEVARYVRAHEAGLSGLSKREATRHLAVHPTAGRRSGRRGLS